MPRNSLTSAHGGRVPAAAALLRLRLHVGANTFPTATTRWEHSVNSQLPLAADALQLEPCPAIARLVRTGEPQDLLDSPLRISVIAVSGPRLLTKAAIYTRVSPQVWGAKTPSVSAQVKRPAAHTRDVGHPAPGEQ